MEQIILIPARLKGTRLPGKPLIEILGKSIIWRVWNQCKKIHPVEKIFIATEDIEIENHCRQFGINCIVTDKANTAIDRIKLFSDIVDADAYINVQGDEPIVNTQDILTVLKYNKKFPSRVVFGKTNNSIISKLKDINYLEGSVLIVLCLVSLVFGFYPEPLLNTMDVSVNGIIENHQNESVTNLIYKN